MHPDLIAEAARYRDAVLGSPSEMLAAVSVVIAGAFVLAGGFVKTMIPLRWLAIASNLGFVAYGAIHPSYPMLLLHAALFPINVYRLLEMIRLTRRVEAVRRDADAGVWLRPYMRSAKLSVGTVLFRQNDRGDRLYFLAEGRVDLLELGTSVAPGQIFGEIAFFSPDRRRRATARCATDSIVLSIDESTVKQLYYQNPAFGFKMVELVAARLGADIDRLNTQLGQGRSVAPVAASDQAQTAEAAADADPPTRQAASEGRLP